MEADIKEVIGTLMRVLNGGEVSLLWPVVGGEIANY